MQVSLKYLLLLMVIMMLGYLGFSSFQHEKAYIDTTRLISIQTNTDKTIQSKLNQLLEELTLGTYNKYSKRQKALQKLQSQAALSHQKSIYYLYYFFGSVALFALLFYLIDGELFIMYIGIAALISLITALFAPLLMMTVYKSFPLIGEVTLSYESKSIYTTITKLFSQKNYLIALLVLLFSVVIPLLKSMLIITYGFLKESGIGEKGRAMIEKIGKWSMADVFIVALLVVVFSTKQDIHTSLKLEAGLYFFIGYVMLSMLGSTLLGRSEQKV